MNTDTETTRDLDVVLYGATGFVGRQTVQYFTKHAPDVRIGLAGRNEAKLHKVAADAGVPDAPVLVANADDRAALEKITARARVVLSTAGPFVLYSDKLVDACVKTRTHYVDITGETPWVKDLIARHHAQTQSDGTRIVPFCGVDSVPSDMGAWWIARETHARFGKPCSEVRTAYTMRGGFNGGTLASALNAVEDDPRGLVTEPHLLTPTAQQPSDKAPHRDPTGVEYDKELDAWLAPFLMAPVNTRAVRRSAALLPAGKNPYAADFVYQEYMRGGRGLGGRLTAQAIVLGLGALVAAISHKSTQKLLRKFGPSPGEGPSEASMDNGFLRGHFVARTHDGARLKGTWTDSGDPGNRITTRMVCEAALTLVRDRDALPGGTAFGGVLTPAVALGEPYMKRLQRAGVQLRLD